LHALGPSNSLAIGQAEAQLHGLTLLRKRIDRADPATLNAIRAEVVASVAATQSFVQQTQGAGSAVTAEKAALQQASEAARGSVTDFMHGFYDEKKFDRYLQFASVEDEQEYRRREDERKRDIEKALAEHTPEGNLRANKHAIEQLKDAGAHGADKSPDYQPTLHGLLSTQAALATRVDAGDKAKAQERLSAVASAPPAAANSLSPDVLTGLKNAGVTSSNSQTDGHGLTVADTKQSGVRSPT